MNLHCTKSFLFDLKCTKIAGGWGSAPDPTGGAYSAPPEPLAVRGERWERGGEWGREGREVTILPFYLNFLATPLVGGSRLRRFGAGTVKHTPDCNFQKISEEGLTEPPPQPPPHSISGSASFLGLGFSLNSLPNMHVPQHSVRNCFNQKLVTLSYLIT